ncbi:MAG: zinc dependent phospholipase C family protein [Deltaproteobacteria bacterium]|nr:zinc dependent phospholipase C family protein [Deltaproteobacteria bacterium]MBZ0220657.1 zinc dependent phospholipase C family protein [Deltaproteobacteria bacterium]
MTVLVVLLLPGEALAWGPATHLEVGKTILENTKLLVPPIRALLLAYPYDFLYGNISADIVIGKNLVEELKHCHNWKVGFRLLRRAETDSQKAFAYGYLSHLSADTIAHNHFIPEMMIRTFSARSLRHIYWEMRFDALAEKGIWQLPRKFIKEVHRDNDRLMGETIEDTPLSFRTNKTIFSSMLLLHRFEQWHKMLGLLSSSSKWVLSKEEKERYFAISVDSVIDLLTFSHKAHCIRKDPTGKHSLNAAKFIRKRLKSIQRSGRDWEAAMESALKWVRI